MACQLSSMEYQFNLRYQSEGDNYPNALTKSPWASWWHRASGQRHRVVVLSLLSPPRVAFLPLLVRKDEQDLGRKTRGGRCPRVNVEGVFSDK